MDPFTIGLAIKAMQAAFSGIEYCVECLGEGTVQVQKIKKAVNDAKAIATEVKSVWSTLRSFFGGKPAAAPAPVADEPVAQKKAKEEYTTHIPNEAEIVDQFVKHVGDFFHHHRELSEYYDTRSIEVYAMDRPDPRDILQLSQIKNELDGAYVKLSGMMRGASVPHQLGPLWDNFNEIYEKVRGEQIARRERERIKRQQDRWQREEEYNDKVDFGVALFLTLLLVAWLWALWTSLFIAEF